MALRQFFTQFDLSCGLSKKGLTLVGVSGGPDSLCLLDILHRLGYPVVVAHFDHELRPDSGEDACKVRRMAEERKLPFVLGRLDVAKFAQENKYSIEEAARLARYRFLYDEARRVHAQAVAVAHTADDQVETVLMHFLRGAGLSGLKGMTVWNLMPEWDETIPLVRPLLGVWRDEILEYCGENTLHPLEDLTNADTAIHRNRLRHVLIPYLAQYNPQIKSVIWRMALNLGGDNSDLEQVSDLVWKNICLREDTDQVVLLHQELAGLSPGLQRRLLRRGLAVLRPGLRDINFDAVERGLSFITSPTRSRKVDWIAGMWLSLEGNRLIISPKGVTSPLNDIPQMKGSTITNLDVPGIVELDRGWLLKSEAQVIHHGSVQMYDMKNNEVFLDADRLTLPLTVRPREVGDRFKPIGMGGHSLKLSDFFINIKLPKLLRDHYPVVISSGEIAWIPGYQPSHSFRIVSDTRKVVCLRLIRSSELTEF